MKTVIIYADGACSGNPGPGGWAAIILDGDYEKELCGGEAATTNNCMELTGVIKALEALDDPLEVELYSDSKYVIDSLRKGWAEEWKTGNWVKKDGKDARNPELWNQLLKLCRKHMVHPNWLHGKGGDSYHDRCDKLAVAESKKYANN